MYNNLKKMHKIKGTFFFKPAKSAHNQKEATGLICSQNVILNGSLLLANFYLRRLGNLIYLKIVFSPCYWTMSNAQRWAVVQTNKLIFLQ